jgi:hypothetical protein
MQALLKYCPRTTVKASKKRLNFCEGRAAVWSDGRAASPGVQLGPFCPENRTNPNGFLQVAWTVEFFSFAADLKVEALFPFFESRSRVAGT